ncbi:hypothetical protein ACFTXM_19495 [Streptomyces sp. NPDC056930]
MSENTSEPDILEPGCWERVIAGNVAVWMWQALPEAEHHVVRGR